MNFDDLEGEFRKLEAKAYWKLAAELSAYRDALMSKGFTRRESMRIVEGYAEIIHEVILDDAQLGKRLIDISDELQKFDDEPDDFAV